MYIDKVELKRAGKAQSLRPISHGGSWPPTTPCNLRPLKVQFTLISSSTTYPSSLLSVHPFLSVLPNDMYGPLDHFWTLNKPTFRVVFDTPRVENCTHFRINFELDYNSKKNHVCLCTIFDPHKVGQIFWIQNMIILKIISGFVGCKLWDPP